MHLSAIPLGEMRTCTFCGSRLRAWYLLVGDPYKPSFAAITWKGDNPIFFNVYLGSTPPTGMPVANTGLGWDSLLRLVVTVTECGVEPMFVSLFCFFQCFCFNYFL